LDGGGGFTATHKYHHAKSCQDLLCDIERRFRAISSSVAWRLAWIRYMRHRRTASGGSSTASLLRLSRWPDISCFLLLDDPANELLLSVRLGTDCVLIRWARLNREKVYHYLQSVFWFSRGNEALRPTTFSYSASIDCSIIRRVSASAG